MKKIKKPWGSEEILYKKNGVQLKILKIKKGEMTSLQCHRNKKETMIAVKDCYMDIGTFIKIAFKKGEMVRIDPLMRHRLRAINNNSIIAEISYGDDSDIIRLKDKYGRVKK